MHYILLPITNSYPEVELRTKMDNLLWVDGKVFNQKIPLLEFEFTPNSETSLPMPDYVSPSAGIPLFSNRFKDVLKNCGVDNIGYHDASIKNSTTDEIYDFNAVNILDLISCVDRDASSFRTAFGSELLIANFNHLQVDESKIMNIDLFRLAERSLIAMVSEKLKNKIEEAGLRGIKFVKPAEWDCFSDTT